MRKNNLILVLMLFFSTTVMSLHAQNRNLNSEDEILKENIYKEVKKKVLNYSMKDFDKLFFEFSEKKGMPNIILTKEQFYNYTIKIAAFSDRLAVLYPEQKDVADANKKKWFDESYEDYLLLKKAPKK